MAESGTSQTRQVPDKSGSVIRNRPGDRVRAYTYCGSKSRLNQGRNGKKESEIEMTVPLQPVDLRAGVAVVDVALFVLEAPGNDDQEIPFTDPQPFLDLSLDPAQTGDPVSAPDRDMVGTKHRLSTGKLFLVSLFRQPYADNFLRGSVVSGIILCRQYNNSCAG